MENTANKPLIYTATAIKDTKATFNNLKSNLPKVVFGILILIILFELAVFTRSLISSPKSKAPKIMPITGGAIIVDSSKKSFKIGESIPVDIRVSTGGKTSDSTDLVLHYDPNILNVTNANIKLGKIYQDFPVADVNSQDGIIRISGITPPGKEGFDGIGQLAQVTFSAIKEGSTQVSVEFTNGSTTDSNIVESSVPRDVLAYVSNLDLTIGNVTANSSAAKNSQTCAGYIQYCQDSKGRAGSQFCSSGIEVNGDCSFDPKTTLTCDSCKIN